MIDRTRFSHNDLNGWIAFDGVWIAFTSPAGWRAALTHPTGDTIIRATREAIFSARRDVTAEDLRRCIADRYAELST